MNSVGQAHEAEFLRVEQQQIRGQAPEILGQQRDLEQQVRLGLAARQLHGGHRLCVDGEAAAAARVASRSTAGSACRSRPPSRADSGSRDARVARCRAHRRGSPRHSRRPTAPPCSASPAACGCSRAARWRRRARRVARAPAATPSAPGCERRRGVAQIQPQRREHLVVARAARVQAAAGRADARGQPRSRCAVWQSSSSSVMRHSPRGMRGADAPQRIADRREVRRRQQPLRVQHLARARSRPDVVAHQPLVEQVVLAGRVREYARIERRALVPQARHAVAAAAAAARPGSAR